MHRQVGFFFCPNMGLVKFFFFFRKHWFGKHRSTIRRSAWCIQGHQLLLPLRRHFISVAIPQKLPFTSTWPLTPLIYGVTWKGKKTIGQSQRKEKGSRTWTEWNQIKWFYNVTPPLLRNILCCVGAVQAYRNTIKMLPWAGFAIQTTLTF